MRKVPVTFCGMRAGSGVALIANEAGRARDATVAHLHSVSPSKTGTTVQVDQIEGGRTAPKINRIHGDDHYWDGYFAATQLDWGGQWTDSFLPRLRQAGSRTVLEIGCGLGHDAARLATAGFAVTAIDVSAEAITRARRGYGDLGIDFTRADVSVGLPYEDDSFDAVMANVALHMFSDETTRAIFRDIHRVVRADGLFLFHVNALDDRPLRERRRPVARELEPNVVLEESGQTVRFFSRDYLGSLLAGWQADIEHVEIADRDTGEPFKRVWRVVGRRAT
jgi:SAM-dependent methyltransferase